MNKCRFMCLSPTEEDYSGILSLFLWKCFINAHIGGFICPCILLGLTILLSSYIFSLIPLEQTRLRTGWTYQLMLLQLRKLSRSGGLLPCGRWWLLEVVSSLDLQIFLFLKPYITLVMWLALWFPLQKSIDRLLLCKLSYFADLIQDSGRTISP